MRRPHDTERAVDPHVAQWAVRTLTRIVSTYAVAVGVTILLGGRPRFSSVSYEVAAHVPGAPWSWGVTIIAAGVICIAGTLLGQALLTSIGGFLAACWSALFAIAFAAAAYRQPGANTTAMWTYCALALVFMVIAGVHYAERPLPWRRIYKRKV